jgi:hypothetical protein
MENIMRDYMPITDQIYLPNEARDICEAAYEPRSFWMEVYPPLEESKEVAPNMQTVCPWSLAAELRDFSIQPSRRKSILDALKTGLNTVRQYHLPAGRILFAENTASKEISVWID